MSFARTPTHVRKDNPPRSKGYRNLLDVANAVPHTDFPRPHRKALMETIFNKDVRRRHREARRAAMAAATLAPVESLPQQVNGDIVLGVDLRVRHLHANAVAAAIDHPFVPNTRVRSVRPPAKVPHHYLEKLKDLEPLRLQLIESERSRRRHDCGHDGDSNSANSDNDDDDDDDTAINKTSSQDGSDKHSNSGSIHTEKNTAMVNLASLKFDQEVYADLQMSRYDPVRTRESVFSTREVVRGKTSVAGMSMPGVIPTSDMRFSVARTAGADRNVSRASMASRTDQRASNVNPFHVAILEESVAGRTRWDAAQDTHHHLAPRLSTQHGDKSSVVYPSQSHRIDTATDTQFGSHDSIDPFKSTRTSHVNIPDNWSRKTDAILVRQNGDVASRTSVSQRSHVASVSVRGVDRRNMSTAQDRPPPLHHLTATHPISGAVSTGGSNIPGATNTNTGIGNIAGSGVAANTINATSMDATNARNLAYMLRIWERAEGVNLSKLIALAAHETPGTASKPIDIDAMLRRIVDLIVPHGTGIDRSGVNLGLVYGAGADHDNHYFTTGSGYSARDSTLILSPEEDPLFNPSAADPPPDLYATFSPRESKSDSLRNSTISQQLGNDTKRHAGLGILGTVCTTSAGSLGGLMSLEDGEIGSMPQQQQLNMHHQQQMQQSMQASASRGVFAHPDSVTASLHPFVPVQESGLSASHVVRVSKSQRASVIDPNQTHSTGTLSISSNTSDRVVGPMYSIDGAVLGTQLDDMRDRSVTGTTASLAQRSAASLSFGSVSTPVSIGVLSGGVPRQMPHPSHPVIPQTHQHQTPQHHQQMMQQLQYQTHPLPMTAPTTSHRHTMPVLEETDPNARTPLSPSTGIISHSTYRVLKRLSRENQFGVDVFERRVGDTDDRAVHKTLTGVENRNGSHGGDVFEVAPMSKGRQAAAAAAAAATSSKFRETVDVAGLASASVGVSSTAGMTTPGDITSQSLFDDAGKPSTGYNASISATPKSRAQRRRIGRGAWSSLVSKIVNAETDQEILAVVNSDLDPTTNADHAVMDTISREKGWSGDGMPPVTPFKLQLPDGEIDDFSTEAGSVAGGVGPAVAGVSRDGTGDRSGHVHDNYTSHAGTNAPERVRRLNADDVEVDAFGVPIRNERATTIAISDHLRDIFGKQVIIPHSARGPLDWGSIFRPIKLRDAQGQVTAEPPPPPSPEFSLERFVTLTKINTRHYPPERKSDMDPVQEYRANPVPINTLVDFLETPLKLLRNVPEQGTVERIAVVKALMLALREESDRTLQYDACRLIFQLNAIVELGRWDSILFKAAMSDMLLDGSEGEKDAAALTFVAGGSVTPAVVAQLRKGLGHLDETRRATSLRVLSGVSIDYADLIVPLLVEDSKHISWRIRLDVTRLLKAWVARLSPPPPPPAPARDPDALDTDDDAVVKALFHTLGTITSDHDRDEDAAESGGIGGAESGMSPSTSLPDGMPGIVGFEAAITPVAQPNTATGDGSRDHTDIDRSMSGTGSLRDNPPATSASSGGNNNRADLALDDVRSAAPGVTNPSASNATASASTITGNDTSGETNTSATLNAPSSQQSTTTPTNEQTLDQTDPARRSTRSIQTSGDANALSKTVAVNSDANTESPNFTVSPVSLEHRKELVKTCVNVLLNTMWTDWNKTVRDEASIALGQLKQGRPIFIWVVAQLSSTDPVRRVDALKCLTYLAVMTKDALDVYLACFVDPYATVRIEACKVACTLASSERRIINALLDLLDDHDYRVRAYAIKALGYSNCKEPKNRETLTWAMYHDSHPVVRAEAILAVAHLGLVGDDQRMREGIFTLLETDKSERVRRIAEKVLLACGLIFSNLLGANLSASMNNNGIGGTAGGDDGIDDGGVGPGDAVGDSGMRNTTRGGTMSASLGIGGSASNGNVSISGSNANGNVGGAMNSGASTSGAAGTPSAAGRLAVSTTGPYPHILADATRDEIDTFLRESLIGDRELIAVINQVRSLTTKQSIMSGVEHSLKAGDDPFSLRQ